MADYPIARLQARLLNPRKRVPTPPARKEYLRTPEEVAQLLMAATTMDEIRLASQLLGLTFREAYKERARLFSERFGI